MSGFKSFILAGLRKKKIEYVNTGTRKDISICCVFKNHVKVTGKKDGTPSLSISTKESKPVFHCWSCGEKGHINKLFAYLYLDKWKDKKNYQVRARDELHDEIEKLQEKLEKVSTKYKIPDDMETWDEDRKWRGLPGQFLTLMGANRWYDETNEAYRILFLIKNGSSYNSIGHIAGRTDRETKPSWLNSSGSWIKNYGLFPREHVFRNKRRTVCLVEGPYDALRMNYWDIPALAFLGVQNWSRVKEASLIANGIRNIVLCLDGDEAGYNTAKSLKKILNKKFNVTTVDLPEGEDPGTINLYYLKEISSIVGKLNRGRVVEPNISFRVGEDKPSGKGKII